MQLLFLQNATTDLYHFSRTSLEIQVVFQKSRLKEQKKKKNIFQGQSSRVIPSHYCSKSDTYWPYSKGGAQRSDSFMSSMTLIRGNILQANKHISVMA